MGKENKLEGDEDINTSLAICIKSSFSITVNLAGSNQKKSKVLLLSLSLIKTCETPGYLPRSVISPACTDKTYQF